MQRPSAPTDTQMLCILQIHQMTGSLFGNCFHMFYYFLVLIWCVFCKDSSNKQANKNSLESIFDLFQPPWCSSLPRTGVLCHNYNYVCICIRICRCWKTKQELGQLQAWLLPWTKKGEKLAYWYEPQWCLAHNELLSMNGGIFSVLIPWGEVSIVDII